MLADTDGVNAWTYNREPTSLDHQPVIQQNRDTLYSAAVVDISKGATVTVPGSGGRYLAVMPINQDGYVNDPGEYELTTGQFGTGYEMLPCGVLVGRPPPRHRGGQPERLSGAELCPMPSTLGGAWPPGPSGDGRPAAWHPHRAIARPIPLSRRAIIAGMMGLSSTKGSSYGARRPTWAMMQRQAGRRDTGMMMHRSTCLDCRR